MSKEQKEVYYEQLGRLKENLISAEASTQIQDILRPYWEEKKLGQATNYEAPLIQTDISGKEGGGKGVGLHDFYKLNNDLFTNSEDKTINKEKDPYCFFKQASNQIDRPVSSIKHFCKHPNDPDKFATLTVASKFFRDKDLQLKEFMCLSDYKNLTKLRLKNYIFILRIFTKIDGSLYPQVKDRLLKIQKLCECLEMSETGSELSEVFSRLARGAQIYDLDKPVKIEEAQPSFSNKQSLQAHYQEAKDEKVKNSFLSQTGIRLERELFSNSLIKEEEKWNLRAKWIEEIFEQIKKKNQGKDWSSWIEAQVRSLSDLDIVVNKRQSNNDGQSTNVFYLYDFLEAQLELHAQDSSIREIPKSHFKEMNAHETGETNDYPPIQFYTTQASNDNFPSWKRNINVRSKFCLKIQHTEQDTEYFLQVFKRRNFGNEKIYEKRLNLRGRSLFVRNMEFQQDPGDFILLSFVIQAKTEKIKQSHEIKSHNIINNPNCEDELHYYFGTEQHYGKDDQDDEQCLNDNYWQNPESSFNKPKGQRINLIFSIQSQSKDPLLLKPNSQFLGFFGDSKFLTYQKVNLGLNVLPSAAIALKQVSLKTESQALRIYEHDLMEFDKINSIDLLYPYTNITRADVITKRFGRLIDGSFYYIHEKKTMSKEKIFVFMKDREEIPIQIEQQIYNQNDNVKFIEKFYPNEKGDKILMISKKNQFTIQRFSIDQKDQNKKIFKQDAVDFSQISEYIGIKQIKLLRLRVQAVKDDFLIIILKLGDDSGPMRIFINDKFICEGEKQSGIIYEPGDISYELNKNQTAISKLFLQVNASTNRIIDLKDLQEHIYEVFELDKKREWYKISYSLLNQDVTIAYPNLFFIYNHDQLYMKDMSQPGMQGYYYMNNFLGIRNNDRPLCVQSHHSENSLITNVPIVEKNYTENQFFLRVIQLQNFQDMSNPLKFLNSLIHYSVFTINEKVFQVNKYPSQLITDERGKLEKDVRIYSKNNSLVIEKIHNNMCIQRAFINKFDEIDLSKRDVTNFMKNNKSIDQSNAMKGIPIIFTPQTQTFITIQKPESVEIFQIDKNYSRYQLSHVVLSDLIKKVWEFQSDETSNLISDILVDSMPKDSVDFYLLLQQGLMKKVSYSIKDKVFNESLYLYNIERIFKQNQSSEFGRKNYIANSILYSKDNIVDLKAEIYHQNKKSLVGFDMPPLPTKANLIAGFSPNDGTFIIHESIIGDGMVDDEDLIMKYVVLPLYNIRMIPQFHQSQFNHPIVPLVDLSRGFTSVFTLNLDQTIIQNSEVQFNYNSQFCKYLNYNNLSPGMLIRFFNGVEHKIPLNEKIIRVDRFTISQDGHNIVIQGLQIKDNALNTQELILIYGLFIYKISKHDRSKAALTQFIPFAEFSNDIKQQKEKKFIFELGEFEFDCATFGNYSDRKLDKKLQNMDQAEIQLGSKPKLNKYCAKSKAENYIERFNVEELEQSDYEYEAIQVPSQNKTISANQDLVQNNEEQPILLNKQSIKKIKKVPKFGQVKINFPQFDLPGPDDDFDVLNVIDDVYYSNKKLSMGAENNQNDKKYISYTEVKSDNPRLKKIHENLKIMINENGHVFLFNRVSNKVYFFYKNASGKYRLYTFVFSDIIVEGADSSGKYVIFWSTDNFVLYDIRPLKEQSNDEEILKGRQQRLPQKVEKIEDFIQIRKRFPFSKGEVDDKNDKESPAYLFKIISCKLANEKIIFQIQEDIYGNVDTSIKYIKVFDLQKQVLINYFEYDKLMLSGDKKFVWFLTQNKVYDIENDLSTVFLWPGGEINCHGIDAMDVFNVSDDKSVMTTHGILYLAFNLQSSFLQSQNIKDVIPTQNDYPSRNLEFFFNLPGPLSLLKTISKGEVSSTNSKDKNMNRQIERENLLAKLNNYILTNGKENPMNKANYAQYLLSYWEEVTENNPILVINIFQVLFSHNSQRTAYIVEDILSSVVQMVDSPIAKRLVNKSFIDFLQTLDTSRAFRDFLDKSISQTTHMKIRTKFPIVSNDEGFTLRSYMSPIMDEGFDQKFQVPEQQIKEVTIQYIFLGDLLIEKGEDILKILNDMKYLGNLNSPFIKYIVKYQWSIVQGFINRLTLLPFFAFLFFFTIYSMWFVSYIDDVPSITSDSSQKFIISYYFLMLVQLGIVGYFIIVQIKHFLKVKLEYITNFLNYIDLIINLLCVSVYVLDWMGDMQNYLRPAASSTLIIVWIKLFYYLRAYDSTSQLIRMIIEIVKDIRYFLLVLFIGIFGFAGGFFILQFGLSKLDKDSDSSDHLFVGQNPLLAVIYIYQMVMGNYILGNFSEYEKLNPFEFYFIWFLFVMSCLFLVIVLMNLLIAIMGATFLKVQNSISNLQIRELVLLISENESLFTRPVVFKDSQFLIIATENKSAGSQETTIDEQISLLRQELIDKVTTLESQQVRLQMLIQNDLKHKFHHQQSSYKAMLATLKDQMIEEIKLAVKNNQRE